MKFNKVFVLLLLGLFMISLVSAWSEDEFNNGLTTENLTFNGDENITRWLSVPEDTVVINAYMNLSGHPFYSICYQESTNTTNQTGIDGDCTLNYSGSYSMVTDTEYLGYLYINYTKPENTTGAKWSVSHGDYSQQDIYNVSISDSCFNYSSNEVILRFVSYSNTDVFPRVYYSNGQCYNGIWNNITSIHSGELGSGARALNVNQDFMYDGNYSTALGHRNSKWLAQYYPTSESLGYNVSSNIYEEAMIWQIPSNITDPYIKLDDTQIWDYAGEFNSPQQTSNIASTINSYIETATAIAGYYLVPFIFHSDTPGILEYLSLVFNNDGFIENSQTYPTTSIESKTETYTANITYDNNNFGVISGKLNLNGTQYTGTKTGSGNNVLFSADATMPSLDVETNFTAYWTISLTDEAGTTNYNLTSNNVTVEIINFSLCDAGNNVPFWNFTILNESDAAVMNSTFEATFIIRVDGSTIENVFNFSDTTGTNSEFDFCISPGEGEYSVDTNIKLTKDGYVDKFYDYNYVDITNATREDNLYMLATGDSTSYIIHVVDVSGVDVEDAEVRVQRYYPGAGEWITTEIVTTNYAGESIGHLLSEDSDYRFLVYQNGVSTYNSTATKIICATAPCTVTLVIPIDFQTGYEEVEDLISTLTYSETTNVFTYTYDDSSGDFDSARLYIFRIFPSNATLNVPCNEIKTDSSGVITCDLSGEVNGTYRASGYITRDGTEFLDKRLDEVLGTSIYNSMGNDGILWGIFVLIGIVMIGISRPSLAIVFGMVGLFVLGIIGVINVGVISLVAVTAIGIILLMRVGKE